MTILLFLFGIAVAAGLFFILADILKLPRLATEKALLSAGRTEKKRMKSLDALILGWAIKLSKFIRMDEYKRHRMERTLSAAGMDMTPEVYTAYTILKPAAVLLAVIPCLLIFPLLFPSWCCWQSCSTLKRTVKQRSRSPSVGRRSRANCPVS